MIFLLKKKRWTLKEAAYKALFPYYRLTWKDISINQIEGIFKICMTFLSLCMTNIILGKPHLIIHDVEQKGINNIKVYSSVSHDGEYVISQVLIEGIIS